MEDNRQHPPIGIKPRFIHDEERFDNLATAIDKYVTARYPLDPEWIVEYNELHKRIRERNQK